MATGRISNTDWIEIVSTAQAMERIASLIYFYATGENLYLTK